jgi:glutathione synthase/RimK-type ligase-like ATP-grasp enzyme
MRRRPLAGGREKPAPPCEQYDAGDPREVLGIPAIKAKIDTGARTSILHAFALEPFEEAGRRNVRFGIRPIRKRPEVELYCITLHRLSIHYNGIGLKSFDAVITRIGASVTFYGTAVGRQFEMRSVSG